jgi:hypothetical protein
VDAGAITVLLLSALPPVEQGVSTGVRHHQAEVAILTPVDWYFGE